MGWIRVDRLRKANVVLEQNTIPLSCEGGQFFTEETGEQ